MSRKNIISLMSIVVSGALVFIFIIPLWSSVKALRINLDEKKQEIAKLEELLAKTEQLTREYQEAEEEAQKVVLSLPKEADLPFLLVQFESLAISNGLLLESVNFGLILEAEQQASRQPVQPGQAQTKPIGLRSASVEMDISGSYNAFKKYLTSLENNIRSLEVRSISFSTSPERKDILFIESGIFDYSLRVDVYYQ